jgi:hypothetical protein
MPSDHYKHQSEDLWQQYHDKKIDEDKYIILLEQLRINEIRRYREDLQSDVASDIDAIPNFV